MNSSTPKHIISNEQNQMNTLMLMYHLLENQKDKTISLAF